MTGLTRTHRRADLGAWWNKRAPLDRRQSAPYDASYSDNDPEVIPHPSNRRRSVGSEAGPPTSPTSDSSHLHYRDNGWASAHDVLDSTDDKGKLQAEEDALAQALEDSRREDEAKAKSSEKEEQDLRRALAESTRLARLDPLLAEKEQAELSQALLASQRQLLIDSHASRPPRSNQRPQMEVQSMSRSSSSNSLEESEWLLRNRNEKGSLYAEAGAHGWLPPGASRPGREEEQEMEMLELAIRISLQEEEERRKRDLERQQELERASRPPLYGQASDSTRYSSYATAPSDFSSSSAPELQTDAPSPPRRKVPPTPQIITAPLSPPTSPQISSPQRSDQAPPLPPNPYSSPTYSTHPHQPPPLPSRAPPTPPSSQLQQSPDPAQLEPPHADWDEQRSGSPYEMPYLTSSPSMRNSNASWQSRSPVIGQSEASHDTGTSGEWSGPSRSSGSSRSRASNEIGSQQQADLNNDDEEDPLEALTVRNPDSSLAPPPPTRAPPPPPTDDSPTAASFPAFESTMTGRSLSLVSEATEPPSPSSAGSFPAQQLFGSERRSQSPPVPSPSLMQTLQSGPPDAPPVSQATHGHEDPRRFDEHEMVESRVEAEPQDEQQTNFGDGVRFGYPQICAHEEDHVCAMDGLSSIGPFPTEVELSTSSEEQRSAFSVEARSWAGLLRFLMWYGETTLCASPADVAASPHRHCDGALSLSFRNDDTGASILRLTFSLLPPYEHGSAPDPELTLASPPAALSSTGKGKGKARESAASSPSTTYMLPDHISLPSRLATSAHSLYSLRHLAQIALSTQPSKEAGPSYHALRSLALSIQQLASARPPPGASGAANVGGAQSGAKGDDLVSRLRERLRRLKGSKATSSSAAGGSNGGAKLQKAPPLAIVERTTAVRRRERVLTADDEDNEDEDSEDYQEARGVDEARRRQEEAKRRQEQATANETRYLPTLGR